MSEPEEKARNLPTEPSPSNPSSTGGQSDLAQPSIRPQDLLTVDPNLIETETKGGKKETRQDKSRSVFGKSVDMT